MGVDSTVMRGNKIIHSYRTFAVSFKLALLGAALLGGNVAYAQSGGVWSLPEPTTTPSPSRVQGPVDGQVPITKPSPTPSSSTAPSSAPAIQSPTVPIALPSPKPSASPAVRIINPPKPAATPAPRRNELTEPASRPTREAVENPTETPQNTTATSVAPTISTEPPSLEPSAIAPDNPTAMETTEADAPPVIDPVEGHESWPMGWWAAILALIACSAGYIILRRRASREAEHDTDGLSTPPALNQDPKPAPQAPKRVEADAGEKPDPAPQLAVKPLTAQAQEYPIQNSDEIDLDFQPVSLRMSLIYATLHYHLSFTAPRDLPSIELYGDMIGAHGSIAPVRQLAPQCSDLPLLKTIHAMEAGETLNLKGDIQLPLNAITALQQGQVSLFVPLVRLCLVSNTKELSIRRVFTVGINNGETALSPLRLDTGPKEYKDLDVREVTVARGYPVQTSDQF